jgi:hypothetical protein
MFGKMVQRKLSKEPIWILLTTRVLPKKRRDKSKMRQTESSTTAIQLTSTLWIRQRLRRSLASIFTKEVSSQETHLELLTLMV